MRFILFLLLFANFSYANSSYDILNWQDLDYEITNSFNKSGVPGGAVAIVQADKILYIKPFGVKQLEANNPVDIHTIFRIASISKTMAAALTIKLIDQGKFTLDTPIYKILDNFKLKSNSATHSLTVKNLLSHTSGLSHHVHDRHIENGASLEDIKSRIEQSPLICRVGHCYSYQNTVFNYLADIIQKTSGNNYFIEMQKQIFIPLSMNDTNIGLGKFFTSTNKAMPNVKNKFGKYETSTKDIWSNYSSLPAAAGVNSSINDMAIWLRAQLGAFPKIISEEDLIKMRTPVIEVKFKPDQLKNTWEYEKIIEKSYGLGWRVYNYSGNQLIFHAGILNGYVAMISYMPDKNIGIVILSNANLSKWPGEVTRTFWDMVLKINKEKKK